MIDNIIKVFTIEVRSLDQTLYVSVCYHGDQDAIRNMFENSYPLFESWIKINGGYAKLISPRSYISYVSDRYIGPSSIDIIDQYIRPDCDPDQIINLAFMWDYNIFVGSTVCYCTTIGDCEMRTSDLTSLSSIPNRNIRRIINKINSRNVKPEIEEILKSIPGTKYDDEFVINLVG